MRIISWNINGAKRFLRECRYDELMAMWLWVDIFAYQENEGDGAGISVAISGLL